MADFLLNHHISGQWSWNQWIKFKIWIESVLFNLDKRSWRKFPAQNASSVEEWNNFNSISISDCQQFKGIFTFCKIVTNSKSFCSFGSSIFQTGSKLLETETIGFKLHGIMQIIVWNDYKLHIMGLFIFPTEMFETFSRWHIPQSKWREYLHHNRSLLHRFCENYDFIDSHDLLELENLFWDFFFAHLSEFSIWMESVGLYNEYLNRRNSIFFTLFELFVLNLFLVSLVQNVLKSNF